MPTALDELTESTAAVAERAAPATVMIGRSGRGSGVVIAPDRVLTNAHNLRDRTTAVTFDDGRVEQASRHRGGRRLRPGRARRAHRRRRTARVGRARPRRRRRGRRGGPIPSWVADDHRVRVRRRPGLPRSEGTDDQRRPRAHRAAGPRLLGWPPDRPVGRARGTQHAPPRRGLLPRPGRRRRPGRPRRRSRRRSDAGARRARDRRRPAGRRGATASIGRPRRARRRPRPRRGRRLAGRRGRTCARATSSSPPATAPSARSTTCTACWTEPIRVRRCAWTSCAARTSSTLEVHFGALDDDGS